MPKELYTVHSVRLDKDSDVSQVLPSKGKVMFDPTDNESLDKDVLDELAGNNLLLLDPTNTYIGVHGDDYAVADVSNGSVVLLLIKASDVIHNEH